MLRFVWQLLSLAIAPSVASGSPVVRDADGVRVAGVDQPTSMLAAGLAAPCLNQSAARVTLFNVTVPAPGASEVLLKVKASSINHLDLVWDILHPSAVWSAAEALWTLEGAFPKVLGFDVSGVVAAVGSGVSRLRVGDEVWGFNAAGAVYDGHSLGGLAGHAWAPYLAISEDAVSLKPSDVTFAEAGVMPLVGLTSLYALKSAGAPWKNGATVLVLGATSGVGHMGVQLAKALGATKVIATASGKNSAFVKSLGVDQFIDYHTEDWWNSSVIPDNSVDAVFDGVLQPLTGDRAFPKLRGHGAFVSLCTNIPACGAPMASLATQWRYPHISQHALRCTSGTCAGSKQLDELRDLSEAGRLRVHVDATFPLENVTSAIAHLASGHVVGRVAVIMDDVKPLFV